MLWFLFGVTIASGLWGSGCALLVWHYRREVQAALNLPRASSHQQIKLHLLHEKQMRKQQK